MENKNQQKLYTLSEFRREAGIPLTLAKKMVTWGEVEAIKLVDGTIRVTENDVSKVKEITKDPKKKFALYLKALGPGVVTGASDDDPSGIGTYSAVGAMFGFSILWMAVWLLPIMLAVQEVCARIGIVTNKGLTKVLGERFNKKAVAGAVFLLIIANVVNIGADLGAMAASLDMLSGANYFASLFFFALLIIFLEIFFRYRTYVKFLKWLTIAVFSYIITGFLVHPNWREVFENAFIPNIVFNENYIFAMVAVFGTTITPYLFFWQTSEEVEENKLLSKEERRSSMHCRISHMRTDVGTGMVLANAVFFFIILATAQVLFKNGITSIDSAEQAALALRPLAGNYAYFLFAAGIIGTGLLAIPVLAGSGAYALSEVMKWHEGLELKFSRARGFYTVIAISILVGLGLNFLHINPIKALYYSAYLNGIIALPLLVVIMMIGNDKRVMGRETHPWWVKFFGWASVVFMTLAILVTILLFFI
jgi:NRAMP (natural resistance-associated macrophage protein)-like metal ion transporter